MPSTSNIPLRQLGKDGPMVPAMGLGCMGLTHHYGSPLPDEEIFAILDRAHELGCTFWDTADLYLQNEAAIGRWFKRTGKRDDIFLASKFGFVYGEDGGFGRNTSPEHARKACEKSLEVLGVDTIDLYYVHILDDETPIEKTMQGLVELQKEGKIKHIGLSNTSAQCLRRANAIAQVAAAQIEYFLLGRECEGTTGLEKNILATCRELGIALVAQTPLGRGIITSNFSEGKLLGGKDDGRHVAHPRFLGENAKHNSEIVKQLAVFADKKGCTLAQLALSWLLKQKDVLVIPGTRKVSRLEENWKAATDFPLTDEEEAEIRAFAESVEVKGDTLPDFAWPWYYLDSPELKA